MIPGWEMAPASTPITSPPITALPCASSSASRKIPQLAVKVPATATARWRTFTTASPVTDAARVNVAAEFPAPKPRHLTTAGPRAVWSHRVPHSRLAY